MNSALSLTAWRSVVSPTDRAGGRTQALLPPPSCACEEWKISAAARAESWIFTNNLAKREKWRRKGGGISRRAWQILGLEIIIFFCAFASVCVCVCGAARELIYFHCCESPIWMPRCRRLCAGNWKEFHFIRRRLLPTRTDTEQKFRSFLFPLSLSGRARTSTYSGSCFGAESHYDRTGRRKTGGQHTLTLVQL